jgi:hypothetical protein
MNDTHIYHIQLQGMIAETEINNMSPLRLEREWSDTAVTLFAVRTDQSGLVGLLRYLHNLGFVFQAIHYK